MERWWINLQTLEHRFNNLEYGPARTDAENWLKSTNVGWFATAELMNDYIQAQVIPELEKAWSANPHWRLGQLLCNALDISNEIDTFYVKDGTLRRNLQELTRE